MSQTIPFRDVLWAVAYKTGQDPMQGDFQTNQAIPIGASIDQWIRRTWTSEDWPEWTVIHQFAPANHIVPFTAIALDLHPAYPPGSVQGTWVDMARVLEVYLVDPRTTSAPVGLDYTMLASGVHCGYEHGSVVWIKYIPPAPRFSAVPWRADVTYHKNDVAYSGTTGECYKSKVSGNLGHDPATSFSPPPSDIPQPPDSLPTEIIVPLEKDSLGVAEITKVLRVALTEINPGPDPGDPPPALSQYEIHVENPNGVQVALALTNPDGVDTLDVIVTDLTNQLVSLLGAGWTITADTNAMTIDIEHASDFYVNYAYYVQPSSYVPSPTSGPPSSRLRVKQVRGYTAATGSTSTGTRQVINLPLTPDDIVPGATYTLTFKDVGGGDHTVSYVANDTDGPHEVLSQLSYAIGAEVVGGDPFFSDVWTTTDTSVASQYATSTGVSLHAEITLPGSPWWELIPMTIELADAVIRGATGDTLKEWGQTQEGMAEEQQVPSEVGIAKARFAQSQPNRLTEQQASRGRYNV